MQVPYALGILQQFGALVVLAYAQHGRQDDGQRLRVVQPIKRSQFVAYHVGGPVLRHAGADQAVQGQRRAPHDVGAHVIIFRIFQCLRPFLNQGLQNAFGKAVLQRGAGRVGQVLLHDVDEGIDHAVADLAHRQAEGFAWVEYGKLREQQAVGKGSLVLDIAPRDHTAVIHFRAGRRQGQYRAKR